MKKIILITALLLLAVVSVSGCTSNQKEYNLTVTNATDFNEDHALYAISPQKDDASFGYINLKYGTKTINGIKVYYDVYNDTEENHVNGETYFEKNGKWYMITWQDIEGNPNKSLIDSEISDKIKNI
ncbi:MULTISPECIES: hypothetical protein [Methanobacterium]|uniref:Uncharacterized protein n=1 Tax=Methanobacterium bryantii TaxID=2161 RepID=A0A2A2H8I2_METBR|nr:MULTISPECIES: hypothetical protein [Methanobacterium]OEC87894.1 hypothetical protein A9507_06880 [Methanobacterium sp. A39]PAV05761.1 hypothetical protein ASJ80_08490 [Methanobacterium bryantii]